MKWGNLKKIIIKILIIYYLLFLGLKLLDYYYFHFRELSQTFPDIHYFSLKHFLSPFRIFFNISCSNQEKQLLNKNKYSCIIYDILFKIIILRERNSDYGNQISLQ